jgi:hypothetical protein
MSDEGKDKELDKERLIAAIEVEMADILVREHGMGGVKVVLDRQSGDIVSSQVIPAHLKGPIFAMATKLAIIKRVREEEERRGE